MNQAESEKLLRQYYRISNTIVHFQNIPLSFDGTTPLRTASIHLIDMIGKHPEANLTELTDYLGVTKGAVSQMAKALEKKDIIRRVQSDDNNKNIRFELCEEGQRIYDGHEKYHEELYGKLNNLMDSYTVEGLASIEKFLDQIEESMLDYKSKV